MFFNMGMVSHHSSMDPPHYIEMNVVPVIGEHFQMRSTLNLAIHENHLSDHPQKKKRKEKKALIAFQFHHSFGEGKRTHKPVGYSSFGCF